MAERLKIAFYGDDFTGSTDALEFLNRAGIKTVLFIDVPTPEQVAAYGDLQAIGVAGISRAQSPTEMETTLYPAFEALKKLNPLHIHYKVCSTFDSSPTVGSIGKAIDIGFNVVKPSWVPLLVAAPLLGRYCLFGNLFARMGIGSAGAIYRLDRHPSMSKHPVTPADESDLTVHLAKQTNKKISLFSILDLKHYQDSPTPLPFVDEEIVLFDALEQADLKTIGDIINQPSHQHTIAFSAGSSGIEMALGASWKGDSVVEWPAIEIKSPLLVLSGSCSGVTSKQIHHALANGFSEIAIDTITLANDIETSDLDVHIDSINSYVAKGLALLNEGKSVIIHTSLGSDDSRVLTSDRIFKEKGIVKGNTAKLYGTVLGQIAKEIAAKTTLERIIIAGGDTSSYAARAMEIESVEMIAPLTPGAPICKAYAPRSSIHNLQVVFKGGQVGKEDFFISSSSCSIRSSDDR
ncbi:MAG: four-carbon acid sugar kinase family protein [Pedobacter sp.]|nr:MAG: four-carbon acid sugar kinase family protein [Pedobacter sp.]